MASNLVTKGEAAELVGRSTRWIEQKRDELGAVEVGKASNGRPDVRFDITKLPPDAQAKWARQQQQKIVQIPLVQDAGQLALDLTVPVGPNLSVADREEATRRFSVIEPLVDREKYALLYTQYPRMSQLYAYLAQAHEVPVRTIYRWLAAWKQGGLPALVRRDRADKGSTRLLNEAARNLLLTLAVPQKGVYGALSIREMWRVYQEERGWRAAHVAKPMGEFERDKYAAYLDELNRLMPSAQLPEISYETFRTWFNRIPEMVRTLGRDGDEAYRNSQEIISHRDIAAVMPMDYVVMDHRRLDIFCLVRDRGGEWRLVRPWLTAAIDMRTRKWLAWAIVETPSSDSIATVLKKVFVEFGLPAALYWDNGKDFICEWFEGRARRTRQAERIADLDPTWRGVLGTLGIRVHHAIVRNARAKLIEPNFNRVSNIDRTMPEWCGHNPGARPERFDELVKQHEAWMKGERETTPFRTIEQVATLYSAALRALNETPLEGADGMRKMAPTGYGWMCPNEAWEILAPKVARRDVPAEVLQLCFAKRKELTIKHGELATTHNGRPYYYRMADNSLRLQTLNGKTVELAYDPLDLQEGAVYYESRFFGLVSCVELRRMGEQAFVQDERDRRAARREVKKFIEAVHQAAPVGADLETRLNRRAEITPERECAARVEVPVALPAPVEAEAAERAAAGSFRFDQVEASEVQATAPAPAVDDDEFSFFN